MHEVATGRANLVRQFSAENVGLNRRTARMQRAFYEARIGLRMGAERHHPLDAGRIGGALELCELRNVAVDDGSATRLHAKKDFRLGVGDLVERAEELE